VPSRILQRAALSVPTLLGLTLLVFLLISLSPGGVSAGLEAAMGSGASDAAGSRDSARITYFENRYGLNQPVLIQYANWLGNLSPVKFVGGFRVESPDLGFSFGRNRPVWDCIKEALGVTLTINVLAYALMYAVAVPLGVLCAAKRGTWIDRGISGVFAVLWSVPGVCMAVLLVGVFASRDMLGWFPSGGLHSADASSAFFLPSLDDSGRLVPGWALDAAWRLVLPVICQAYGGMAVVSRLVRTGVVENMGAAFVRTARAKGVPERDVVVHHAFRAGLLPLVTVFASTFPAMLSGSIVVERVFSLPGMGSLMLEAVGLRDRELLMATVLMAGVTTMLAVALADALYRVVDPRTRRA
jgi:microcin C transport system permease protein